MRKKICVLFMATVMALSMTACVNRNSVVENAGTKIESAVMFERHMLDNYYSILVEKETGVCYLEYEYYGYYGITIMLNADGTPKIWNENE